MPAPGVQIGGRLSMAAAIPTPSATFPFACSRIFGVHPETITFPRCFAGPPISGAMNPENSMWAELTNLLRSQRLAVLSTHDRGQPYASLVAFAASEDLKTLVFATSRTTRKYHNLARDARVAMLIDNRTNTELDFHAATAATVVGSAREVEKTAGRARTVYLARHPYLEGFVNSESCALVELTVEKYLVVNRFQTVFEFRVMA